MNRLRAILCIGLALCAVLSRAERRSERQNFAEMSGSSELVFANSYKTGITPLVTYTCYGDAAFGLAGAVCLNMTAKNDSIVTTRVEQLVGLQMTHGLQAVNLSDVLEVSISRDSVTWTKLTGGSITYNTGSTECSFPRGNYFIKWKNIKKSSTVNLQTVIYRFDECNCFVYTEE